MTLADKIIRERKKKGWSQEELAEKVDVSRQAVSKWEAGQSTPDLDKILLISKLFGVTTDYLLKDEVESEEYTSHKEMPSLRRVTLAEAEGYLEQQKSASLKIAIGVLLCIVSVFPLLILIAASDTGAISESLACGIGIGCIFPLVALAVVCFVRVGLKNSLYHYLDNEPFDLENSVTEFVQNKQAAFRNLCIKLNCIAAFLCIISPVAVICGAFSENDMLTAILLVVTMLIAAIGIMFFIISGVRWVSFQRLLRKGEYSDEGRRKAKVSEAIETTFWLLVVAIYLGWSFLTGAWHITWVIWPVAGVLSAIVSVICNLFWDKSKTKS
ncbi:MAG: helix-turn-helix transcriptional regulator [Clostridia bacterium]|nr:helix-turn-helix transcriptional regulator [Clostridia bacterium]